MNVYVYKNWKRCMEFLDYIRYFSIIKCVYEIF